MMAIIHINFTTSWNVKTDVSIKFQLSGNFLVQDSTSYRWYSFGSGEVFYLPSHLFLVGKFQETSNFSIYIDLKHLEKFGTLLQSLSKYLEAATNYLKTLPGMAIRGAQLGGFHVLSFRTLLL